MKKFTIVALAICLAFAMAAPAMAVDANFSGYQFVRGIYVSQWDLRDTSESNSFMNMRFRLQTVFKASDILSITTRFDALDAHVWGTVDGVSDDNIDFDRAYMTIKSPYGDFYVGRMAGATFGTSFQDSETDVDRIVYVKKINNLTLKAIFEKVAEYDNTLVAGSAADADNDKYCLAAIQKMENITAGVLGCYYNYKSSGTDSSATGQDTTRKYLLNPYFVSKFGPLAVQGELSYGWGTKDYDLATTTDIDYKTLSYNIEATYNIGPASIMAGYAFVSGDGNGTSTDHEDSSGGSVGNDWEKLFILTTNEVPALYNLGDYGNLSGSGIGTNKCGAKIIYGGVTYAALDNLKLGVIAGKADADELTTGISKDDYGTEYDFTLTWKIYDNLTYTAIAAYLDAGDFYWDVTESTKPAAFDDTYALFHQLMLTF